MVCKRNAFTLIELLIVISIAGFLLATIFKATVTPKESTQAVLDEINNLVAFARQEAISKGVTLRINCKEDQRGNTFFTTEKIEDNTDFPGYKKYSQLSGVGFPTKYQLQKSLSISAIYLENRNVWGDNPAGTPFYITPNGLVQSIKIRFTRKVRNKSEYVTITMQPFSGTFEVADE